MKYLIIAIMLLALTGCGAIDRGLSRLTGNASEICHDKVIYLQFTSGATVKFLPNGSVATCEGK